MPCNVYVRGYSIMSNKHFDNKDKQTQALTLQQQSDEAFINELYDEVSQEDQSQPSELLDKRIISAAHKAINTSNKPIGKNNFIWYSKLATAASLTLVISLVALQQDNIFPNERAEIMLEKEVTIQESIKTAPEQASFSDKEIKAAKINFQDQTSDPQISTQMASPIGENTKLATNESIARTMQYEKQTQLLRQKSAKRMVASSPINMALTGKVKQEEISEKSHKIIVLSIKQFQQYTLSNKPLGNENQWFWSLSSESNIEYIIDVFQNNQRAFRYRLDKTKFKISDASEQKETNFSLKNKALSRVVILNTNN